MVDTANQPEDITRIHELMRTGVDPGPSEGAAHPTKPGQDDDGEQELAGGRQDAASDAGGEEVEQSAPPAGEAPADEAEDDVGDDDTDEGSEDEAETLTLEALAEKLGITAEELYATAVGFGDGRDPVSLGKIKDAFVTAERLQEREETLDRDRTSFEQQQEERERMHMTRSRELSLLMGVVDAQKIPPEILEEVAHAAQREKQQHRREVLELFGNDEAAFREFSAEAGDYLREYGYRTAEMQTITDPRMHRLMRDVLRDRKRLSDAQAALERARQDAKKLRRRLTRGQHPSSGPARPKTAASEERDIRARVHAIANQRG